MDKIDAKRRSWNMSRIKSNDTAPELLLRSSLHRAGYRFRLHYKNLPGKPDIVLPKYQTVIFVNGCFWHMHTMCGKFHWPSSNQDYWRPKILRNVERDRENYNQLEKLGWKVIIVWECELKKKKCEETIRRLICEIRRYTIHRA